MPAKEDDLGKIGNLLLDFFEEERIHRTLDTIHQSEASGWEKWWQIEFAIWLDNNDDQIAEWDMEHSFQTDKRTRLAQDRMALDIGFRLKRHEKDDWYFVELKQAVDYRRCIDNMCKDAEKVYSAKILSTSGLSIRYIACAGLFHAVEDRDEVIHYAADTLADRGIEVDGFFLEPVGKSYWLFVF